ncbi:MAG: type VI-D CRISPR-associated RNA-guided ribonuclease Cas13d, partial [Acutalibacteraceae bacterium]
DIPEAQLIRYCKTAGIAFDGKNSNSAKMAKDLAEMLNNVRFDNFLKVKQIVQANSEEARQKERYKAIIRLYLTVLYLIVKSLVKVNMSYTIAFGILERDCSIMNQKYNCGDYFIRKKIGCRPDNSNIYAYAATKITDDFKKAGRLNKRVETSIETNKALYKDDLFYEYRNNVAHLNVIAALPKYVDRIKRVKSYFDLYHYILFLKLMENSPNYLQSSIDSVKNHICSNGKTIYENVCEYNTVSKDFLYGINTPFAYNAARYINLSNREKFLEGYGK